MIFSGSLRMKWTHGVWRLWPPKRNDANNVLSTERPNDARIVLNLRHGLVTDKEQHSWYQYWWKDYPIKNMSEHNQKMFAKLQENHGVFDLVDSDEEELDVDDEKNWKSSLKGSKKWQRTKLTRVWSERLVEVV